MSDDTEQDLLLGVGVAGYLDCDAVLPLREYHPSGHAGFQLQISLRGGVVTHADPRMGLMHRGAEKLFESRDYRQIMMLANRHDWLSAFSSELGIALALEAATGITPPPRATWIRTLMAEANRVAVALAFLAPVLGEAQGAAQEARETLAALQERATGNRVHPMFNRIGGVASALDTATLDGYADLVTRMQARLPQLIDEVREYAAIGRGLAVLGHADAIGYGASGPVARASGLDLDLRRDDAYLAYGELRDLLTVPVGTEGDTEARYEVLGAQVPVSLHLMSACIDELRRLGDGPVDVLLPKVVRAPESVTQTWIEGPLGISGCLLASAGDKTPWRLKIRSASFNNVQAMGHALVGTPSENLADAVMSFFFVVGDVDR